MSKLHEKISSVAEFHEVFKIGNAGAPCLIEEKDFTLRYNLIKEENEEYLDACRKGDLVEIAGPRRFENALARTGFIDIPAFDRRANRRDRDRSSAGRPGADDVSERLS